MLWSKKMINLNRLPTKFTLCLLMAIQSTVVNSAVSESQMQSAVKAGDRAKVEKYIQMGGSKNMGHFLIIAAQESMSDIVALFVGAGVDINTTTVDNNTALMYSAWQGDFTSVKNLVNAGANLNHQGASDQTALILASWFGHEEIVRYLLSEGADPHLADKDGRNALQLAKANKSKYPEIISLLSNALSSKSQTNINNLKTIGDLTHKSCKVSEDLNVSERESKAIRYLLANKLARMHDFSTQQRDSHICIEKIFAKEKIPLQGDTVVKYEALVSFPYGYKTECLEENSKQTRNKKKNDFWDDFYKQSQVCSPYSFANSGTEPMRPGQKTTYSSEDRI